jgi:uncharacterized protein YycO
VTIPQPGDFGLVSIPGGVGFLIRLGQWLNGNGFKNYEHAFVYLDENTILEAMPGGAIVSEAAKYASVRVSMVPLTASERQEIVSHAWTLKGVPYSFLDYFAIAAHRFRLPLPGLRKYIANSGHLICSQLVDNCYQAAKVELFKDNRWGGYVTPAELIAFTEA